jgi:hypothetical protein
MREVSFMRKWGIFLRVAGIVAGLLVVRFLIDFFKIDVLPELSLIGCFVGGTLFVIAIILAGVLADFKESEKLVNDLATSIITLCTYCKYINIKHSTILANMRGHIKELLSTINSNFKQNTYNLEEINRKINGIRDDIKKLAKKNVEVQFITTLQAELSSIYKISNRIETIMKTSFIPASYIVADVAVGVSILLLLFARLGSYYEGLIIIGSISFVLVSLILLIKDMDNPFEVGNYSAADVDLSTLFKLEQYLETI